MEVGFSGTSSFQRKKEVLVGKDLIRRSPLAGRGKRPPLNASNVSSSWEELDKKELAGL